MALSLIRGKYVICKIHSRTAADVIEDGAVVQRDGTILAVGPYAVLAQHYQPDETFGSAEPWSCLAWSIATIMWVSHPSNLGRLTIRSSSGSPAAWRRAVSTRISIRCIPLLNARIRHHHRPAPARSTDCPGVTGTGSN